MKPFDDKFADNVRQAFDGFHEEMPPQAWNAMKARLDGKARAVALWPWLAKVAGVALLVGMPVFLYLNLRPKQADQFVAEKTLEEKPEQKAPVQTLEETTFEIQALLPEREIKRENLVAEQRSVIQRDREGLASRQAAVDQQITIDKDTFMVATAEIPEHTSVQLPDIAAEQLTETEVPSLALRPETERKRVSGGGAIATMPALTAGPGKGEHGSRLSWGVTASSMLAFAENRISSEPGYAAGVLAEFALSENISLSSGGMVSYHQFELINFAQPQFAADYLPSSGSFSDVSLTGNNQYEMLALEIPLNAHFSLMQTGRRNLYLGVGLSSLVYLQQRFTGTNTAFYEQTFFNDATGSYELQYAASTFMVDEKYAPFSRFDIGRLFNLSLGYVMRREKSAVVIEPFVKLPVGTLTSRDINLGMGGISLKYRFSGN